MTNNYEWPQTVVLAGKPIGVFDEIEFQSRKAEIKWFQQQVVIPLSPLPKAPEWRGIFFPPSRRAIRAWELEYAAVKELNNNVIADVQRAMVAQLAAATGCSKECVAVWVEPRFDLEVMIRGKAPCYVWSRNADD